MGLAAAERGSSDGHSGPVAGRPTAGSPVRAGGWSPARQPPGLGFPGMLPDDTSESLISLLFILLICLPCVSKAGSCSEQSCHLHASFSRISKVGNGEFNALLYMHTLH